MHPLLTKNNETVQKFHAEDYKKIHIKNNSTSLNFNGSETKSNGEVVCYLKGSEDTEWILLFCVWDR